jgi:hypothetical protein
MIHTSTNILLNDSRENNFIENVLFKNELFKNYSRENVSIENNLFKNDLIENNSKENNSIENNSIENNLIMVPLYLHRSVFFYDNLPIYTRGLHMGPSCLCYNIKKNTGVCLNYFLYQNRKLFSEFRWYMFVKRLYQ